MRVLIGLSALASLSLVAAQQTCSLSYTGSNPVTASAPQNGTPVSAAISIYANTQTATGSTVSGIANAGNLNTGNVLPSTGTWSMTVAGTVTALLFVVKTNAQTAQMNYKFTGSSVGAFTWICDPCTTGNFNTAAGSSTSGCNTLYGPVAPNTAGYACAQFTRNFYYAGLVSSSNGVAQNSFGVIVYDTNLSPGPNSTSFSFNIVRTPVVVVGDPQIVGMQGQDFQVHGMPDEIFNIVTYPTVQVNARFTYLESAECHDNFTACFAHPGTYISEQGFRLGKDKIRITAGSFKKGLQVHVNGKKIKQNVDLKSGAVELVNHRRVIVHTDIMKFIVSNSDKFMNQELELKDDKLIALGAERKVLKDNERFHPEVPLHGLQGQTWRNVEYASGLDYEGSIMDYHAVDGNLFGTDFVFNQFQA